MATVGDVVRDKRRRREALAALDVRVRAHVKSGGGTAGPLAAVAWVGENMLRTLDSIDPEEVPSNYALKLLDYAKGNEAQYRKDYDCKRIPAKGFAVESERGLVDDGSAVADVMAALREVVPDVQVRVVSEAVEGDRVDSEVGGSGDGGCVSGVLQSPVVEGAGLGS